MPLSRPLPLVVLSLLLVASVEAQEGAPLVLVNDDTEVRALGFEAIDGALTFDAAALELQIATTAPSFCETAFLRCFGIGQPEPHPFNPIELQKDVVRLERYYARNGFPRALVDYEVVLDSSSNRTDVTFQIAEGPPLLIEQVELGKPGAPPISERLAPELRPKWEAFARSLSLEEGERLTEFSLIELQNRARQWLRRRGYARADVGYERFLDSTGLAATVRLKVIPGPRAVYDEVRIERVDSLGQAAISDAVLLREMPFRVGDTFDAQDLVVGQREIFSLGTFQLATVDVENELPPFDSTVTVVIRVREAPLKVLRGFGGYFTEGGVSVRGEATHRNTFGGARQATFSFEARTGILDQSNVVDGLFDYRASLALRQPYLFSRALSLTVTPSLRRRNDEIERAESVSLTNTVLYTRKPLQTAGLTASVQTRRVDAFRSGASGFLDLGSVADELAVTTSAVGLEVTAGFVDNPLQPRSGFILRPSARIAVPPLSDFGYGRAALTVSGFYPLSDRSGLSGKFTGGVFQTQGDTDLQDPATYLLLRDQYFYSGGASDVRGWAVTQLGPKLINFRVEEFDLENNAGVDSVTTVTGYVGLGGRSKLAGSLQANLPFFLGPQWGSNVFLDAGIIPSAFDADLDGAFGASPATEAFEDILSREGGLRYAAGAGLQYLTPVGFIGVAVGYKLNPSYLDLRDPETLLCGPDDRRSPIPNGGGRLECDAGFAEAAANGEDFAFDDVEASRLSFFGLFDFPVPARSFQLQFTFGQSF
ncbi:MAG: BamA/TamA family outer membrane protein [Bacteroidota bacterium]